jgi:hypothetical protein
MEVDTSQNMGNRNIICTSSWTAYVRPVLIWGLVAIVGFAVGKIGILIGLGALARLVYQILYIRSIELSQDDQGVWCSRGILPWNKGVFGVKWRDIDQAHYYPNFLSYMCRSYTIRIGHRYTKSSEVILQHMKCGNAAVEAINQEHANRASAGVLN